MPTPPWPAAGAVCGVAIARSARFCKKNVGVLLSATERGRVGRGVDADLDEEPDSHFKKFLGVLGHIEALDVNMDGSALIDNARMHVKRSIVTLEVRKREQDEGSEDEADWTHVVTQKKEDATPPIFVITKRSVFDDIDK